MWLYVASPEILQVNCEMWIVQYVTLCSRHLLPVLSVALTRRRDVTVLRFKGYSLFWVLTLMPVIQNFHGRMILSAMHS